MWRLLLPKCGRMQSGSTAVSWQGPQGSRDRVYPYAPRTSGPSWGPSNQPTPAGMTVLRDVCPAWLGSISGQGVGQSFISHSPVTCSSSLLIEGEKAWSALQLATDCS